MCVCIYIYIYKEKYTSKKGDCKKTLESYVSYKSLRIFQKIIVVEFRSLWSRRTVDDRYSC